MRGGECQASDEKVVIVGAGGHARVVIDIVAMRQDTAAVAIVDSNPSLHGTCLDGILVVGDDSILPDLYQNGVSHAALGVGALRHNRIDLEFRKTLFEQAMKIGFDMVTLVHRNASVAKSVEMGCGVLIAAQAAVNPGVVVGDNVVVNTGVMIDHDCRVNSHVQLAPGAVLAGDVEVGEKAHIGAGATIIQSTRIGNEAIVAAGAVVIHDVPERATVMGVPARIVHTKPSS